MLNRKQIIIDVVKNGNVGINDLFLEVNKKTLEFNEVDKVHEKLIKKLEKEFDAEVRK